MTWSYTQKIPRNSLKLIRINEFSKVQKIISTHKNQLYFYMLAMNNPKMKLRGNFIENNIKKNKIGINF